MKTNALPAVIMLTAGLIDCILSIYCRLSLWRFTWQLLVVLVIFYILGCVVKVILDSNFKEMAEKPSEELNSDANVEDEDGEKISNEEETSEEEKLDSMESGGENK